MPEKMPTTVKQQQFVALCERAETSLLSVGTVPLSAVVSSDRGESALPLAADCRRIVHLPRSGLTLLELLIVVIILTTLVATVIPVMVPAVEARRVREAARGISTFIAGARARAIRTGRPVGVLIQRMAVEQGAAMALFVAEKPVPFSGSSTDAAVSIKKLHPNDPNSVEVTVTFGYISDEGTFEEDDIRPHFIQKGDKFKVSYQGNVYKFTDSAPARIDGDGYYKGRKFMAELVFGADRLPPSFKLGSVPLPYQIFLQPRSLGQLMRSAARPYQLPDGTVIDLSASGLGNDLFGADNSDPIVIMFSPSGRLDDLYFNNGDEDDEDASVQAERPTSAVHLLVGLRENVPPATFDQALGDEQPINWMDTDSLWVSIGPQTGQVGTAENDAAGALETAAAGGDTTNQIRSALQFAREMHSMGGR